MYGFFYLSIYLFVAPCNVVKIIFAIVFCQLLLFLTLFYSILQVARPITLKKEAIQTRNRKLAAKAKKAGFASGFKSKVSGSEMTDFFRFGSYAAASAGSAMGAYPNYPINYGNYGNQTQFNSMMAAGHHFPTGFGTASAFFGASGTAAATA